MDHSTHRISHVLGMAVLLAAMALLMAGCGKPGTIWGQLVHDGYCDYLSVGGFPNSIYWAQDYEIKAGSYTCDYTLDDGAGTYYPGYYAGYPNDPSWYYTTDWSVTANPGSIPMVDGLDSYFVLYLSYDGLVKSGSVESVEPLARGPAGAPQLGTHTWTQGGLLITATTTMARRDPGEASHHTQVLP